MGWQVKVVIVVLLIVLGAGAYSYFCDPSLLQAVGLGGLLGKPVEADQPPPPPHDDSAGLVKCIDAYGQITFSNTACPEGQSSHKVKLNKTEIVHYGTTAASGPNQVNGDSSSPKRQTTVTTLNNKFGPQ